MNPTFKQCTILAAVAACSLATHAADWSDTSIG